MNEFEKIVASISRLEREIERLKTGERYQYPVWKTWVPNSYAGWSSLPSGTYRYLVIGNLVICEINMTAGTSNGTGASLGLPIQSSSDNWSNGALGYAVNNGTVATAARRWLVQGSASVVNFYQSMGTTTWTNSGTKYVKGTIFYEGV